MKTEKVIYLNINIILSIRGMKHRKISVFGTFFPYLGIYQSKYGYQISYSQRRTTRETKKFRKFVIKKFIGPNIFKHTNSLETINNTSMLPNVSSHDYKNNINSKIPDLKFKICPTESNKEILLFTGLYYDGVLYNNWMFNYKFLMNKKLNNSLKTILFCSVG